MSIEPMPLSTFAVVEFGGEAVEATYKVATSLLKAALQADNITLAEPSDPWAEAWCGCVFAEHHWRRASPTFRHRARFFTPQLPLPCPPPCRYDAPNDLVNIRPRQKQTRTLN